MNLFTYLYFEQYLVIKNYAPVDVSRRSAFVTIVILQLLNLDTLYDIVVYLLGLQVKASNIFVILTIVLIACVFLINYWMIDFDYAEKEARIRGLKVSPKFFVYLFGSILFAAAV